MTRLVLWEQRCPLRDALHPIKYGRGAIDKGRRAIEGVRHHTVHSDARMLHLKSLKQTQSELLFGGRARMRRRFRWSLCFGDALLLQGLFLLLPRAQLGSWLIEGNPHGDGNWGRYQHEEDQALSPDSPHFPYRDVCREAQAYGPISSAGYLYRR